MLARPVFPEIAVRLCNGLLCNRIMSDKHLFILQNVCIRHQLNSSADLLA